MKLLGKVFPYLAIIAVVILLAITNYKPGTLLTGWDNLHPEFNLLLNIKRSFFAVWQEYQSFGLLGGMGHASDIVRQIFLLMLSSFMPASFLRFFWTILTLIIGAIGTLHLSKTLIANSFLKEKGGNNLILPTFAALFYILNLATLQSYYAPFETFTAHFAFLPWMILASLHFLNRQSIKNALILSLVFFLTTPQSYVPTLFVVFAGAMTILLAVAGVKLIREGRIKKLFIMSAKYYAILFISNAFWLLPFLYFTTTNASVNVNAKINQMATEQIVLQNKEFGKLLDTILLKGFWFSAVEPNLSRVPTYMLGQWMIHIYTPWVQVLGVALFILALIGLIVSIAKKEILLVAFSVLFILVFAVICNNAFPFSLAGYALSHVPLLSQAFRFPFTKLSLLLGLLYSLFAAFGLGAILLFLPQRKLLQKVIPLLFVAILFIYMLPAFRGNFFYEKEQLKLPQEYTQVFSYFDKKDPSQRIATLPASTFWSWNYYSWGYGGSGFLWYGIKQPIVDRAFDVWGETSENGYNELSYALYSKDKQALLRVLNKFQITYLLLDKNVYSNSSPKALFYDETETLLSGIPQVKKDATFGDIAIYKVDLAAKPHNYVVTKGLLPSTNEYIFNNDDKAYKDLGFYKNSTTPSNYYPFANFFTNKLKDDNFEISEKDLSITFTQKLPELKSYTLTLPEVTKDKTIPIEIVSTYDNVTDTNIVSARIISPVVSLNGKVVTANTVNLYPLFVAPKNATYSLAINSVRATNLNLNSIKNFYTYIQLGEDNYFTLSDQNSDNVYVQTITKEYLQNLDSLKKRTVELKNIKKNSTLSVSFPKVVDLFYGYAYNGKDFSKAQDCNGFRSGLAKDVIVNNSLTLIAENDSQCIAANAPTLTHEAGYLVKINSQNNSGRPFHFWTLNENEGTTPLDLYLDSKKKTSYLMLSPMEKYGVGYSFHLDNISIGNNHASNTINSMEVVQIPCNYLRDITITQPYTASTGGANFSVTHPNESLYLLKNVASSREASTIILSQSYDSGWKAYELTLNTKSKVGTFFKSLFPFVFGREIKSHVLINNWENGWEYSGEKDIVIVYLPQYLQYGGFLSFMVLMAILLILQLRKSNSYFAIRTEILKQKVSARLHK